MAVVLKLKLDEDMHRVLLEETKLNFEGVQEAIRNVYPAGKFTAKYLDADKDLCTLVPTTLTDFLAHAVEHKGKKTLKLELFRTKVQTGNAASTGTQATGEHATSNHANHADMMQLGMHMLQGFLQKGLGKGFLGAFHCHGHGHHIPKPLRALKLTAAQMHRQGLLNSKSLAALILGGLPDAMALVTSHPDKVNWKIAKQMSDLLPLLQDLQDLVAKTAGLEHCAPVLAKLMQSDIEPCEAILQVLSALDSLPFDAQVAFLEALYTRNEEGLKGKLKKMDDNCPWISEMPMVHEGVSCDGCNKRPIYGLRFKCNSCPDYDLCAECFANKSSVHNGDCSSHTFTMKTPPCAPWMAMYKGMAKAKGKGKSKGKGKGKAKCCGKVNSEDIADNGNVLGAQACAREGCTYACTWHPTHCCALCAVAGEHGGHCQRKAFVSTPCLQEDSVTDTTRADEFSEPISEESPKHFDFCFPVEVGDGRRLSIAWNKGDMAEDVAQTFALAHGIEPDELSTIRAFMAHTQLIAEKQQESQLEDAAPSQKQQPEMNDKQPEPAEQDPKVDVVALAQYDDSKDAEVEEVVSAQAQQDATVADEVVPAEDPDDDLAKTAQHLVEMGLGDVDVLLALLRSNGGSVQRVLDGLLNGDMVS